ncbi:hypothetical protein BAUCODRAFT_404221 [Baudoinia panamericana UAMH 10762]|uniref:Phosducin domain-containing protein n=1 Tax=Baudoinia panamericana (strain UAMH 10762) TaxID=717646 RepID=M2NEV9_BAUPA|nr:uncharacterized protein BAUCODRAFT_404221 [Baudoinia panamericana UAMH 10762]EMC97794.1 hypothetical protein BAUCODRAFT_404221 [Baudoinia panamericana UAMH 10762]
MSSAQQEFDELMRDKERRTMHPEDDEDGRSFLNISDDEGDRPRHIRSNDHDHDEEITASRPSHSRTRSAATIPFKRYEANTGPKGVISDAQNFRDSRRQHRVSMRSTATLPSQQYGGLSQYDKPALREKLPESGEEEDGDDDDEDLDDDFMKQWRSSRLREMQSHKGSRDSKMHLRQQSSRRTWGGLATVDGDGYLDALDRSGPDTVVIVYIYDDEVSIHHAYHPHNHADERSCEQSEVSHAIEECIRALAKRHIDTRFIKLSHLDAEMEPAGVPALLAYRGGEKFAGLVPIVDELPEDAELSERTLEAVLQRHQTLR